MSEPDVEAPGQIRLPRDPDRIRPIRRLGLAIKKHDKCMAKKKTRLPEREGVLPYDPAKHVKVIKEGIRWKYCPEVHRPIIERIIQDTWDKRI
jgi:hypothetical protein